jgi:hypothetical protein
MGLFLKKIVSPPRAPRRMQADEQENGDIARSTLFHSAHAGTTVEVLAIVAKIGG